MAQAQAKSQVKSEAKVAAKKQENKSEGHPKQHQVTVIMTDGTKFPILTTWGKEGDILRLDVDPKNHPAWQEKGQTFVNANDERVTKFKSKFGNFDFIGNKEDKK